MIIIELKIPRLTEFDLFPCFQDSVEFAVTNPEAEVVDPSAFYAMEDSDIALFVRRYFFKMGELELFMKKYSFFTFAYLHMLRLLSHRNAVTIVNCVFLNEILNLLNILIS